MNPDVLGHALNNSVQSMVDTEPALMKQFSLVIVANQPASLNLKIAALCWSYAIPLIIVRSIGYVGYIRLQLRYYSVQILCNFLPCFHNRFLHDREHSIVESKTDADQFDLRIAAPFPALADYCEAIEVAPNAAHYVDQNIPVDTLYHSHIPYIVLLYKAIQQWRCKHGNIDPKTIAEKDAFKQILKIMAINYQTEVNFEEAIRESYRAYTVKSLSPEALNTVLSEYSNHLVDGQWNFSSSDSNFQFLCCALAVFMGAQRAADGTIVVTKSPPLPGPIPDMASTTDMYVELQRIYQQQAENDCSQLKASLQGLLVGAGRPADSIGDEEIEIFCKNSASLLSLRTRTVEDELTTFSSG